MGIGDITFLYTIKSSNKYMKNTQLVTKLKKNDVTGVCEIL